MIIRNIEMLTDHYYYKIFMKGLIYFDTPSILSKMYLESHERKYEIFFQRNDESELFIVDKFSEVKPCNFVTKMFIPKNKIGFMIQEKSTKELEKKYKIPIKHLSLDGWDFGIAGVIEKGVFGLDEEFIEVSANEFNKFLSQ